VHQVRAQLRKLYCEELTDFCVKSYYVDNHRDERRYQIFDTKIV